MNRTEIRNALAGRGFSGVATTRQVAELLGLAPRTIRAAKSRGEIAQVDRNTFAVDSIVGWLYAHQRYLVKITGPKIERETP